MTNIIAEYHIDKLVSTWSNKTGAGTQYREDMQEHGFIQCTDEMNALEKIMDIYSLDNIFEKFDGETPNYIRFCGNQIENDMGEKDENGKYLADYNIYIALYQKIKPEVKL